MSLVLDRISSLPDEVICHILSFIPIKDTVATSLLSKRWYPLWRSVSVIDLTDEYYARNWKIYPKFHHFLFSLLLFRDATQPIKRFTLKCLFEDPDHKIINACVTSVLQCGVEYLKLEMRNVPFLCKLPIGILSCKTLVFLNLFGFCVRQVSSVDLPLVKTLHLERVGFKGKCSLLQLLSGCPNLEDFKAIDVESTFGDILEKFKSLTKLIRAEIHVNGSIKLPLEVLYNVEYLSLIMEKEPPGYNNIPTFYNLARMKLLFREEYRWQWLVEVLDHCPKLRILDVNNEFSYETQIYQDDNLVSPKVVPESVSLHLRKCTVRNYEGKKGELHLVRYLMQNASVLQTMRIYYKSGSNSVMRLKMKEELSLCKKLSPTCQLSFY